MASSEIEGKSESVDPKQIKTFAANWDILEELVSDVYSRGQVDPTDLELFVSLKLALKRYYQQLADEIRPYWMQVKIAGRALRQDPFAELLDTPGLSTIISNWDVMAKMPAAREALNLMIVAAK